MLIDMLLAKNLMKELGIRLKLSQDSFNQALEQSIPSELDEETRKRLAWELRQLVEIEG